MQDLLSKMYARRHKLEASFQTILIAPSRCLGSLEVESNMLNEYRDRGNGLIRKRILLIRRCIEERPNGEDVGIKMYCCIPWH